MIAMRQQLAYAVREPSQVGQVRRAVAQQAALLGFDDVVSGRAAIVATELGNNLVRHARDGLLFIARRHPGVLELLAVDHGPGMADAERCLRDGYSTAGTPGTGLGAVRRLSDAFGLHTREGIGTAVLSRISMGPLPSQPVAWGGACLPAPGETESGDGWTVAVEGSRAHAVLVDGLGHGPPAAVAAKAALQAFEGAAFAPLPDTLERLHRALHGTRGAAASVLAVDAGAGTLRFAGIGNVAGRVVSGIVDRGLLAAHGTLGAQVRRATEQALEWPPHALAVLHSDGLANRWSLDDDPGLLTQDPALIAAWLLRRHRRGRDDATVLVMRRA